MSLSNTIAASSRECDKQVNRSGRTISCDIPMPFSNSSNNSADLIISNCLPSSSNNLVLSLLLIFFHALSISQVPVHGDMLGLCLLIINN